MTPWTQAVQPPVKPASSPELAQTLLDSHSEIAWRTLNRGNFERAEAMFRDILRRDPNRPRKIAGLGAALRGKANSTTSIETLHAGAARFPKMHCWPRPWARPISRRTTTSGR